MGDLSPREVHECTEKRKKAIIGVVTLGLAGVAIVGFGKIWDSNLFQGTSFDQSAMSPILKILSFCFVSVLIAVPFFVVSLIKLIYYSIMLAGQK